MMCNEENVTVRRGMLTVSEGYVAYAEASELSLLVA